MSARGNEGLFETRAAGDVARVLSLPIYKNIYVPVDNSRYSSYAVDLAVEIAGQYGSHITGSHVYAAKLHDRRFRDLEAGLPERYRQPQELERQRRIHDSLITKGLQIITDSYLDTVNRRCAERQIPFAPRSLEGKNYAELVRDISDHPYDLVVMGAKGLGDSPGCQIGSVCERVVRRIRTDVLVVKGDRKLDGTIVVAVDGSQQSFYGLTAALQLARIHGARVTAVAAYDPYYHVTAFRSLEGVLSAEAGRVFRFKEQEQLHNEIIDKGIAKVYSDHLKTAQELALKLGVEIETQLLEGKPFLAILQFLHRAGACLVVAGRVGIHADQGLDIGATTENLLRQAPCHVLVASGRVQPPAKSVAEMEDISEAPLPWSEDALKSLDRVPPFARAFARKMAEEYAKRNGYPMVTAEILDEARQRMHGGEGHRHNSEGGGAGCNG